MQRLAVLLFAAAAARGEVHVLTLRQSVERALAQNPDLALARLEQRNALEGVRIAKDPFTPRITVGSGLAYSSGFPMSIEGSAPSVFQASATQFLFNRPQSYAVAQRKEDARTAAIATSIRKDEVAFRTTTLFLDAEKAARVAEMARKEVESLQKVADTAKARVEGGYELPVSAKQAAYNLARGRQSLETLEASQADAETSLAIVLGFGAEDRVRPAAEERGTLLLPESEEQAIEEAVRTNPRLRRFQSQIAAKGLEIRGEKAARLPRIDLVAQYAMFAKFNRYEDYFRTFQRNNGQLGVSVQLPILPGPGVSATAADTEADIARLRIEMNNTRNQITIETRQAFRQVQQAQRGVEVARLALELARDQLSVNLALLQEGRIPLRQVEESRIAESDRWIGFYDAQYALERARWALLHQTGDLLAALR